MKELNYYPSLKISEEADKVTIETVIRKKINGRWEYVVLKNVFHNLEMTEVLKSFALSVHRAYHKMDSGTPDPLQVGERERLVGIYPKYFVQV